MAIATYTDLQAAVAGFLHRDDLTAVIPDFITLAEAQMNRRLRVRRMIQRSTATISDEFSAVPSDFLGVRAFELSTSPVVRLEFCDPDALLQWKEEVAPTGKPVRFSIVGGEFQFSPAPDGEYEVELTYYQAIPALASNSSNWLLTQHPDAYLYGALLQSAPYLRSDERLGIWGEIYTRAIADIEAEDARASYHAPRARHRAF